MKLGLQGKLSISLVILLGSSLFLLGYLLVQEADKHFQDYALEQAKLQARTLAGGSLDALVSYDYELLERWVASSLVTDQYAYAGLVRVDGTVLTHTNLDLIGKYLPTTDGGQGIVVRRSIYQNQIVQEVIHPAILNGQLLANAHIAYFIREHNLFSNNSILLIAALVFVTFLVLIISTNFLTYRFIHPIKLLTESINSQQSELKPLLQNQLVTRRDEVGELGRAYNAMTERLQNHLYELNQSRVTLTLEIETRKQAQRDLETARDRAIKASEAKDIFLATMSHELRTPLNAIIGYCELLQEEFNEKGLLEYLQDLQTIDNSGKHLLNIINDILDLTSIESGSHNLYITRFSVCPILQEMANSTRPLVEKNGNTLSIECPDSLGDIESDKVRLKQIFYNLIGNACKFTQQGHITITADISIDDNVEMFIFTIADTGIGFDERDQHKIFQAFYQSDNGYSRKMGGTGLGLAISHSYCVLLGGSIEVFSQPNQGTTFVVKIPANATSSEKSQMTHNHTR